MVLSSTYDKLIPIFTSSTSGSPQFKVSATSTGNYSCPDWKALNGTTTNGDDCWVSESGGGWLTVTFDKLYTLAGLWFKQRIDPRISDIYFYTSKDGENWELQVLFNNKGIGDGEEVEFPFDKYVTCKYIKIGCDGTYVNIGAFNVFYMDVSFLLKMNDDIYSIRSEYYNIENKKYNLLDKNEIATNYSQYCFDLNDLLKEITINGETFRPIDKFDNFSLLCNANVNINALGLKTKRELIVPTDDIDISIAEEIKYFKVIANKEQNIKLALSIDKGVTWYTYANEQLVELNITIPLKPYKTLNEEEVGQWTNATNMISNEGIAMGVFNSMNFQELLSNSKRVRFAYVINRDSYDDVSELNSLMWKFDSKGSMKLMKDSEYDVDLYENSLKITSLIENPLIKANILL